ncbi:hypothetical protein ACLKA7_007918 [Drosophila subpalustris]
MICALPTTYLIDCAEASLFLSTPTSSITFIISALYLMACPKERFKPFNLATDAETADTLSYSGVSAVPEAVITLNDDKEVVLQIQHLNIAAMMGK